MKRSFIIVLLLGLSLALPAQDKGVKFEQGTLAEALKRASSKKKEAPNIVFVDCYTTWCGPCKIVNEQIFPLEEVGEFFNKHLISIKIDMEKGEGAALKEKYNVQGYPTFLFLDANGREINRFLGVRDAAAFLEAVKRAMDPSTSPAVTRAAYEQEKSLDKAIAYLQSLRHSMDQGIHQEVTRIFRTLPERERYSEAFWSFLSHALATTSEGEVFDAVLHDKLTADRYLTKERVDHALYNGLFELAKKYVSGSLKGISEEEALERINYIAFVGEKSQEAVYVMKIVKLYREGKGKEIQALLDARELSRLNEYAQGRIAAMLTSMKEISADTRLKYLHSKIEYNDQKNAQTRRLIDAEINRNDPAK
ncbi:MAG: thioredoxin family protein [Odoribacteraceae bacterium]|jgi:thiol-disulfide isomerase/thioredoxin|nr:thioredoxin family protein [Odoribacteraceae bacterium]